MPVERTPGGTSLIDVLDRILDKGIVIDAWIRVSLVGIDLITVEARVVVASIDTYLRYAEAMGITQPIARPGAVVSGPVAGGELGAGEPLATETTETRTTRVRRGEELG
jgi:gas vesicle structural protein